MGDSALLCAVSSKPRRRRAMFIGTGVNLSYSTHCSARRLSEIGLGYAGLGCCWRVWYVFVKSMIHPVRAFAQVVICSFHVCSVPNSLLEKAFFSIPPVCLTSFVRRLLHKNKKNKNQHAAALIYLISKLAPLP